jgi:hypothetical protein
VQDQEIASNIDLHSAFLNFSVIEEQFRFTVVLMYHFEYLFTLKHSTNCGRAIVQAVSRRLPSAAARVQIRV